MPTFASLLADYQTAHDRLVIDLNAVRYYAGRYDAPADLQAGLQTAFDAVTSLSSDIAAPHDPAWTDRATRLQTLAESLGELFRWADQRGVVLAGGNLFDHRLTPAELQPFQDAHADALRAVEAAQAAATTPCGGTDQPCCHGGTCAIGQRCLDGTCAPPPPCGARAQPCCAGDTCGIGLACVEGHCQTPPDPLAVPLRESEQPHPGLWRSVPNSLYDDPVHPNYTTGYDRGVRWEDANRTRTNIGEAITPTLSSMLRGSDFPLGVAQGYYDARTARYETAAPGSLLMTLDQLPPRRTHINSTAYLTDPEYRVAYDVNLRWMRAHPAARVDPGPAMLRNPAYTQGRVDGLADGWDEAQAIRAATGPTSPEYRRGYDATATWLGTPANTPNPTTGRTLPVYSESPGYDAGRSAAWTDYWRGYDDTLRWCQTPGNLSPTSSHDLATYAPPSAPGGYLAGRRAAWSDYWRSATPTPTVLAPLAHTDARATSQGIEITWVAAPTGTPTRAVLIERQPPGGSFAALGPNRAVSASPVLDSEATARGTWRYRLTALDEVGHHSAPSDVVAVEIVPRVAAPPPDEYIAPPPPEERIAPPPEERIVRPACGANTQPCCPDGTCTSGLACVKDQCEPATTGDPGPHTDEDVATQENIKRDALENLPNDTHENIKRDAPEDAADDARETTKGSREILGGEGDRAALNQARLDRARQDDEARQRAADEASHAPDGTGRPSAVGAPVAPSGFSRGTKLALVAITVAVAGGYLYQKRRTTIVVRPVRVRHTKGR